MTMDDLDDWFAAARADAPRASDALLARIGADAAAEAGQRERGPHRAPRAGFGAVLAALGGRPAALGLAAAALAGVAIGVAVPASIPLLGFEPAGATYDLGDLAPGWSGWDMAMLDGG